MAIVDFFLLFFAILLCSLGAYYCDGTVWVLINLGLVRCHTFAADKMRHCDWVGKLSVVLLIPKTQTNLRSLADFFGVPELEETLPWDSFFLILSDVHPAVKFSVRFKVLELGGQKSLGFRVLDSNDVMAIEIGIILPLAAKLNDVPADLWSGAEERFVHPEVVAEHIRLDS